jgi:hypothetical protein
MIAPGPSSEPVPGRPPRVIWRPVPQDEFPLDGLLRLLFEPRPAPDQEDGGGRAESP